MNNVLLLNRVLIIQDVVFGCKAQIESGRIDTSKVSQSPWAISQILKDIRNILNLLVIFVDIFNHQNYFDTISSGGILRKLFEVVLFVNLLVAAPEAKNILIQPYDHVTFKTFRLAKPFNRESEFLIVVFNRLEVFYVQFKQSLGWKWCFWRHMCQLYQLRSLVILSALKIIELKTPLLTGVSKFEFYWLA